MLSSTAFRRNRRRPITRIVAAITAVAWILGQQSTALPSPTAPPGPIVRLSGHVLPVLEEARPAVPRSEAAADEPLTVTLVLKRDDQAGFEGYLREVYDPKSSIFRQFSSQKELTDRFGPSREAYDALLAHLTSNGLELIRGSENRLSITVRGTRDAVERAFAVHIGDYRLGDRTFYANDDEPALPERLAPAVVAISGLTNLATPQRAFTPADFKFVCEEIITPAESGLGAAVLIAGIIGIAPPLGLGAIVIGLLTGVLLQFLCLSATDMLNALGNSPYDHPAGAPDGAGQTIGLLQFDKFRMSDVEDYVALIEKAGGTIAPIGNLETVPVNGGVATPGPGQVEVLLDVAAAMRVAPGARVVVYHAPFGGQATSYATLFNAMIDDGVDVISNSWSSCEDEVTLADVQGIDAVLQTAAASGISVFNATGDSGSTCLNGSPNTVGVPAGSPHATAVGGTSLTLGPGFTYGAETWWDGEQSTPPTGQGGFGVSRFFPRPDYQDGSSASDMRSVPDVVAVADPATTGTVLCQADGGGCPTGSSYGGTSLAAPIWAAFAAQLNQAAGQNLGFLNPLLYPLAGSDAFHDAASMGSDFGHVGLGSPNLNVLDRMLSGASVGPPDAGRSKVETIVLAPLDVVYAQYDANGVLQDVGVPADGTSKMGVLVRVVDADGYTVSGRTVSLTPDAGSAVVAPASAVTTVSNGSAVFEVTDLRPETVTFTAVVDGAVLDQRAKVTFVTPPAASAGIVAFPTTVNADGTSTTTITVTLQDALGRPVPGKLVTLSQGDGHSVITGPDPSVTDASGQIQFTATNLVNETVTYTAVDVNDGNLPVPGSAEVTFQDGVPGACGSETPPTGVNGYSLTPFATGFEAGAFFFGSVNFQGCQGASVPAFVGDDVFISNFRTGDLFAFGLDGGAAANPLANHGPTLAAEAVGADGRLYALRVATTGNATTGAILELDPKTGGVLRTVASNLLCPHSLVVDPLSGDLFYDDFCFGGFVDAAIHRVRNPASATPTVEVYATLPRTPNGRIAFAPDGTLFVVTGYTDPQPAVVRVSGTDGPTPPTVETIAGVHSFFWVNVAEVGPDGEARSLLLLTENGLELVDITTDPPLRTVLAEGIGGGTIGPDGCLYASLGHTVFKLTDPAGGCSFLATAATPALSLTPAAVSPNPLQGSTQAFTATFRNVDAPEGTVVFFQVSGANPTVRMVRTNAAGEASFTYVATFPGDDEVVASATVDDATLTSNLARLTWDPGRHVTYLTLNPSPRSGRSGRTVTVRASLTDSSVEPPAPVEGATVDFTLADAQCSGVTDAGGLAECELVAGSAGTETLGARFAGTAQLVESSAAIAFDVIGGAEMEGPLGDLKCYVVRSKTGTPRFAKIPGVRLDDEFETLVADVLRERRLCNPVAVDDAPVHDLATYLACHALRPVPGQRPVTPPDLTIRNRFGEQTVRFLGGSNEHTLCVPAEAHLEGVEPADASLDGRSFRCRRVKSIAPQELTPAPQLVLADEFESKLMRVRALDSLCTPVAADGEETAPADSYLACYALSQAPRQPAFRPPGTIELTSDLGAQSLEVRNARRTLCVPSERR
ncbi:MAG: protease pro-enzyme activation domain-containing protein [Thermodesulfobacteriota bacterium]